MVSAWLLTIIIFLFIFIFFTIHCFVFPYLLYCFSFISICHDLDCLLCSIRDRYRHAFVLVCLLLLFLSYLLILSFFYFHFLALAYMSYPANLFASHFLLAFFSSYFLDPFPTPLNSFLSLLTFFPYLPLVIYREEVALILFWVSCGGVYWVRWMQYMPLSRCDLSLEFPPPVFPLLQSSPAHILLAIPNTYISPTMYCIYR